MQALEQIGPLEYVETLGMYLEEFVKGAVIHHRPGRTVSEVDNTWLTLLSMNQHPLHFDAEYGRGTEFGRVLVNSVVTFAIINGMSVRSMSAKTIANLGWDSVRLTHPVFIGDTLYAKSKVLNIRDSQSRPGQGIVVIETIGHKGDGTVVLTYRRSFLVPKRNQDRT
ncbi:MaoC family dehydratase [Trinickia fusca]|uniref:MaoC family dehydratase n=1 Tax=Trinickia fusca TaxID=2419777 RepID=A0A494XEX0_9BURK|nr:MaoC family dehydratase [Trinickia fusca]RKP49305.1 MaoC family dehydratase [Trinickia fusca]